MPDFRHRRRDPCPIPATARSPARSPWQKQGMGHVCAPRLVWFQQQLPHPSEDRAWAMLGAIHLGEAVGR